MSTEQVQAIRDAEPEDIRMAIETVTDNGAIPSIALALYNLDPSIWVKPEPGGTYPAPAANSEFRKRCRAMGIDLKGLGFKFPVDYENIKTRLTKRAKEWEESNFEKYEIITQVRGLTQRTLEAALSEMESSDLSSWDRLCELLGIPMCTQSVAALRYTCQFNGLHNSLSSALGDRAWPKYGVLGKYYNLSEDHAMGEELAEKVESAGGTEDPLMLMVLSHKLFREASPYRVMQVASVCAFHSIYFAEYGVPRQLGLPDMVLPLSIKSASNPTGLKPPGKGVQEKAEAVPLMPPQNEYSGKAIERRLAEAADVEAECAVVIGEIVADLERVLRQKNAKPEAVRAFLENNLADLEIMVRSLRDAAGNLKKIVESCKEAMSSGSTYLAETF